MKSSNKTKQKNETRFLSGEWKRSFSIMLLALLFSFTQNANAQAPQWEMAKGIAGTGGIVGGFVNVDDYGNIYSVGAFSGTIDLDPGPGVLNFTSTGSWYDIYILKLDKLGNLLWGKAIGTMVYDNGGTAIEIDKAGNIYFKGLTAGKLDVDPGSGVFHIINVSPFAYQSFVCKYDSAGNFIWANAHGCYGDQGNWMEIDNDGNIYGGGYFFSTIDFDPGPGVHNLTSVGAQDIYVYKLDSSGNFKWAHRFGSGSSDHGFSITTDNPGNAIVSGSFSGTVDFDPGPGIYNLTSKGSEDVFVLKLSSAGNLIWARSMGGGGTERAQDVSADGSGNVVATGFFASTVDFDPGPAVFNISPTTGWDCFIAKLDSSGNFVWAKSNQAGIWYERYFSDFDAAGNVYTLGAYEGTVDIDPGPGVFNVTSQGSWECFLSKLGAAGNFEWGKSIGGSGQDFGFSLVSKPAGEVFITMHSPTKLVFDSITVKNNGSGDTFIAKLSDQDPCNIITCTIDPKIHMVNVANVTNASCNDGKIKVNLDGTFQFFPHLELYNNANVMVQSVSLLPGTTYYRFKNLAPDHYTVKVYDDKCCETVLVANVKCAPPATGISTTNVTATSVQFNWDVVNCAVGYRIHYREQGSSAWWTTAGVNTNVGSKSVFGLNPATTYEWQVATKCFGFPAFDKMEDSPLQYFTTSALPINCSEILKKNPAAPSGVYTIDPDGAGGLSPMSCNCDMVTDGGGWMLVLNYNRLSGTDPALKIRYSKLPLQNQTTPGFDESNTIYWGHASNDLMSAIPYDEVRFYGVTTNHNRVMNFKTNDIGTVNYFKTGIGHASGMKSNFTALSGHNTNLPASINAGYSNAGNLAMTLAPFYKMSAYHWDIKHPAQGCNVNRWEVDDWPCSYVPSTFHQIWVRQSGVNPRVGETATRASTLDISLMPNPATHMVTVNFENGNPAAKLKVLNTLGQVVIDKQLQGADGIFEEQLDVSKLNNGIYFLLIQTASETGYTRFVKN